MKNEYLNHRKMVFLCFLFSQCICLFMLLLSSCEQSNLVFFPRIGMPLKEMRTKIGRAQPDTLPVGKPPYYMHVKVFGILGNLGIEADTNGTIVYIGFEPDDRSQSARNTLVQICEDTLGKPTSESFSTLRDPTYANYTWVVENQNYQLTLHQKFITFFAGIPKETDQIVLPPPR